MVHEEYNLLVIAKMVEETIDLDRILKLTPVKASLISPYEYKGKKKDIKVAIAYDEAFNFYYNENLKLIREYM